MVHIFAGFRLLLGDLQFYFLTKWDVPVMAGLLIETLVYIRQRGKLCLLCRQVTNKISVLFNTWSVAGSMMCCAVTLRGSSLNKRLRSNQFEAWFGARLDCTEFCWWSGGLYEVSRYIEPLGPTPSKSLSAGRLRAVVIVILFENETK